MNESDAIDELVDYIVWGDGITIYDVTDVDIED